MKEGDKRSLAFKVWDFFINMKINRDEKNRPTIVVETKEDLQQFIHEHPIIKEFYTKVVGVSFPNDDGSSRQAILSNCRRGDYILLKTYSFRGRIAYAVHTEHGQIGNLPADLAECLETEYDDDFIASGEIYSITGGAGGLYYGCKIHLILYQA